jgi:hypothetical protein
MRQFSSEKLSWAVMPFHHLEGNQPRDSVERFKTILEQQMSRIRELQVTADGCNWHTLGDENAPDLSELALHNMGKTPKYDELAQLIAARAHYGRDFMTVETIPAGYYPWNQAGFSANESVELLHSSIDGDVSEIGSSDYEIVYESYEQPQPDVNVFGRSIEMAVVDSLAHILPLVAAGVSWEWVTDRNGKATVGVNDASVIIEAVKVCHEQGRDWSVIERAYKASEVLTKVMPSLKRPREARDQIGRVIMPRTNAPLWRCVKDGCGFTSTANRMYVPFMYRIVEASGVQYPGVKHFAPYVRCQRCSNGHKRQTIAKAMRRVEERDAKHQANIEATKVRQASARSKSNHAFRVRESNRTRAALPKPEPKAELSANDVRRELGLRLR